MFSNIGIEFSVLQGKTITGIEISEHNTQLIITCSDNIKYIMHHYQDCCERVYLEDIVGSLEDITGDVILLAEEVSNRKSTEDGSLTWTFYKLVSNRGAVTLRWLGESNGYYSEDVCFELLEN